MTNMVPSPLGLLLVVAAAASSNGFLEAANLRQRNLGGYTIATNVYTYMAYEDYASTMLAAVNKQRATKSLSPLCLNKKLHNAAQGHTDDMATNDYMAHGGSDGSTVSQRITQTGFDWEAVGENVAAGQVNVDDVMVAWINSPEHLENIMGDYTMFGSAYAFNRDGTYQHYWTQDFGSGDAEECDGAVSSDLPYETPNVDQVQSEAEAIVTPAPTTATYAIVPETPDTTSLVTDAPVTPTPTTESPKTNDCESSF